MSAKVGSLQNWGKTLIYFYPVFSKTTRVLVKINSSDSALVICFHKEIHIYIIILSIGTDIPFQTV